MSWDQHTSGVECVKQKKRRKKGRKRKGKKRKKGKTTLQLPFAGQGSHRLLGQKKKKIGHRIFIIVLFFTWQSFRKL